MSEPERVTYYTIQHRTTQLTEWAKPDGELKPAREVHVCYDDTWTFSSFDHFGAGFNPWVGQGNDAHRRDRKMDAARSDLWQQTRRNGWLPLRYALKALKNVRKADAAGEFDSRDGYRSLEQRACHEYRVVKVIYTEDEVSVVDLNDPDVVAQLIK